MSKVPYGLKSFDATFRAIQRPPLPSPNSGVAMPSLSVGSVVEFVEPSPHELGRGGHALGRWLTLAVGPSRVPGTIPVCGKALAEWYRREQPSSLTMLEMLGYAVDELERERKGA